ncbi:MAG: hypothetical protein PHF86_04985 [Candidatus Nanoarchaeia archaeon]|nr:hypothetical protein [Candidatus Nanoarchaeia archaeon]
MSNVADTLLETAEAVINQLGLNEETVDRVQEIILDNFLPLDDDLLVIEYFKDIVLCPRCSSLLGPQCDCPH